MNKKGQGQIGIIILMGVMIIVGLAFIPTIFDTQAGMTQGITMTNVTFAVAGAGDPNISVDITGQELISGLVITNATGQVLLVDGVNVSFSEGVSPRTGTKRILMTTVDGAFIGTSVNVSMVYGAEGYIDNAGGRGVASMIGLFTCLALLAGCLYYWYQNGGSDILGK